MPDNPSPAFVLTVSGSDASGAAGLQADNRAIYAANAFPLNVVTALTLQTREGVQSVELSSPELVRMHLVALLNAYPVQVTKAGMLGNAGVVEVLAETLQQYPSLRLVLDPIVEASSGRPLLDNAGVNSLVELLVPHCYLITPNLPELATLVGKDEIKDDDQESDAANRLIDFGCHAVLVKGGHRPEGPCVDRLYRIGEWSEFSSERISTTNNRGTGCALASLIAGGLANGLALENSIEAGKQILTGSLEAHTGTKWPGSGPAFY